jgi:hypothetical protein
MGPRPEHLLCGRLLDTEKPAPLKKRAGFLLVTNPA